MKSLFLAALVALMSSEALAIASSSNSARVSTSQRIVAPIPAAKT